MNIGFTGTRNGMTEAQKVEVYGILLSLATREKDWLHNGLAIGADKEAAVMAYTLGYWVKGYPSNMPEYTCNFIPNDIQDPKPPLERNPDIVAASEVMLATPGEFKEVKRSGTWATIREAWRTNTPIYIIYPDGRVEYHGPE